MHQQQQQQQQRRQQHLDIDDREALSIGAPSFKVSTVNNQQMTKAN
jgi:hypothetical protein